MENKGVFNIRQQAAGSKVEIYIYGDVVDEKWCDDETSLKSVIDVIQGLDTQEIDVYIDSSGATSRRAGAYTTRCGSTRLR